MSSSNTNLVFRNDTILGVCEAIGQDFGFHPNWLRVLLASLAYFAPVAVIGGYVVLGMVVALSRYLAPNTHSPATTQLANSNADTDMALAA